MRTTAESPEKCPNCGSRVCVVCKFRDQKRARFLKMLAIFVAAAIGIGGNGLTIAISHGIDLNFSGALAAGGVVIGSAIYTYGHQIPKMRDLACVKKCGWKETFIVVRKFHRLHQN